MYHPNLDDFHQYPSGPSMLWRSPRSREFHLDPNKNRQGDPVKNASQINDDDDDDADDDDDDDDDDDCDDDDDDDDDDDAGCGEQDNIN